MPLSFAADTTVETRLVQWEANEMLLDGPAEVEAILESNKTNRNPAFAKRAAGDERCRRIAVLLCPSEPNIASDHRQFLCPRAIDGTITISLKVRPNFSSSASSIAADHVRMRRRTELSRDRSTSLRPSGEPGARMASDADAKSRLRPVVMIAALLTRQRKVRDYALASSGTPDVEFSRTPRKLA